MLPVQTSSPLNTNNRFVAFMKDEMKCSDEVIQALEDYQGVKEVKSFDEFESSEWNRIAKQFLNPPMKMVSGNLEKQSPIIVTATSMKKLKAASCAVRYYTSCGYELIVQNMKWTCVEEIYEVMKSLDESKDLKNGSLPKLTRDILFPIWLEKHLIVLDGYVGKRSIPLSYVFRKDVIPDTDASENPPKLLIDKPYAEEYGSVEMALI